MASNSFVIFKYIFNRAISKDLFEKEYHSSIYFGDDPKSRLEIQKFLMDMPFPGGLILVYIHTHVKQIR